tara:strand:+ start:117 stop:515 length:399 start_codon:yes stop_codon:yes gene_type:complete
MGKNRHYIDDPNLPELPLFQQGAPREEQIQDMVDFVEDFKAYARNNDPVTSHEAAEKIQEGLPSLEAQVLKSIRASGSKGQNSYEVEIATGIPNQTCTPRLAPLRRKGLIVDSGERRPGGTGRNQIVWKAEK